VDDFTVGGLSTDGRYSLQPDVPEISTLNLIDWISPKKALFMSGGKEGHRLLQHATSVWTLSREQVG
jgi:hypothetical protein